MDRIEKFVAAWLGVSVFLQAWLIGAPSIQYYIGAGCLALLAASLWRSRSYLNPHVDMLLIMLASGGLGMLVASPGHIACAMGSWRGYGWMVLFGFAPAIPLSRCLRVALRQGYLLWALLIDAGTMFAGMWLSGQTGAGHGEWAVLTQHMTMLGGMLVGMLIGMWMRSALFGSRSLQNGAAV
jgi:hypothetical protein